MAHPPAPTTDDAPAEVRPATHGWFRPALAIGWVAMVAFHLWLSSRIGGPSVVYDEPGYLGNARWLAGGATWEMPVSPTYAIGYPVLLAPVMAVFDTADAQWGATLAVNAVLLASVLPLAAGVLRRVLGLDRPRAFVAAAVAALVPAVVAAGVSAIAENLVLPLVLASMLAAWSMTASPSGSDGRTAQVPRLLFGPSVAVLAVTHARFSLVVVVALAVIARAAATRLTSRRVAIANAVGMVVLVGAGRVLADVVQDSRWERTENLEGGPSQWLDLIGSGSGWGELASTAVGQAWYLAAGSLGLGVIGIVHLVAGARADRADRADRAGEGRSLRRRPTTPSPTIAARRRLVLVHVLSAAAAVFATSVVFFAQNQFRADHWVYGRHNDSFTPLWVAAGVAALLSATTWRRRIVDVVAAAVTVAVLGVIVAAVRDPAEMGGVFSPFAVPAIVRHVRTDPDGTFTRATVTAVVAVVVLGGLAAVARAVSTRTSRRPAALVTALVAPALAAGWFVYAGYATVDGTDRFESINHEGWHVPEDIRRLGIRELTIEGRTGGGLMSLMYPWALPGVHVFNYDAGLGEQPATPFAVARLDDPYRPAAGDRVALLDEGGFYAFRTVPVGLALWVGPGPEQDRLDDAGLLLPEGFPAPLPESARQVSMEIVDRPRGAVSVAPGGGVDLRVVGRHEGTGSPWPDALSFGLDGRVRVAARITPRDPAGVPGAPSGGELQRWVRPGDRFRADVRVLAVGETLGPLPGGTYDVQLGVTQEGEGWFAPGGGAATFTMVVR